MLISNNNPQFKGISMNTTKFNGEQMNLAYRVYDAIKSPLAYDQFAKENMEFVILPAGNSDNVRVKILDLLSGKYVKGKNVTTVAKQNSNLFKFVDKVFEKAKKIVNNEIARPKREENLINNDHNLPMNKIYSHNSDEFFDPDLLPYRIPSEGLNIDF